MSLNPLTINSYDNKATDDYYFERIPLAFLVLREIIYIINQSTVWSMMKICSNVFCLMHKHILSLTKPFSIKTKTPQYLLF